ncbi:uncharacterized protein HMPREF1541_09258 [Cyphellophora europaea CBS 101466]|uniref:Uncharacterized protein n=1 Tax=Cyphellophora europaea (strain CBS 101466) TaxID=1220924 RepID=W2S9S4_CYPE1|nr:uncharacterized protein HMPREF1541_09258 [Cyphellophora europaea CBS 101466]ETN45427.1 hypothetical protein HMPREF1541_09258 [Cyphellophora europaea CBS 101466]
MGISGLLPLLKSIQKPCTLKKFAGQTIGVDAYGWLHRGTVACAIELVQDKPTTKYVDFAVGRVRMLLDFGITPYLVFDGDSLPSKADTNAQRRKRREESKAAGLELLRAGKTAQAHQELQKAAAVTPYMAKLLIEQLKQLGVQYLVAPYEADAQLVYLEQKGIINGILSEDSDMLVYGAKRLITKLNQYAECVEIERINFALCKEISLTGWTDAMFRRMAILSGCDYLPSIEKMGLKTAYRFVRKYKDAEKVIRMVQFEGKLSVPADYIASFQNAELTFIHHRVFCPERRQMVFMEDLQRGMKEEDMPYLGKFVDPDTAVGVACGDLDPKTKQPFRITQTPRPALRDHRRQTVATSRELKPNKSLDSFLISRQPLAELDPNSLTPSPSQQRLLERHRNASWEPRIVSSAPQLRTSTSMTTASSTRTDRNAFLSRASAISSFQAPKRQRLCSDAQDPSPTKEVKRSPFFATPAPQQSPSAQKQARIKKSRRAAFDVWSDDSVDDILLGLPDVQQAASPQKKVAEVPDIECVKPQEDGDDEGQSLIPQSSPAVGSAALPDDVEHEPGTPCLGARSPRSGAEVADAEVAPFEDVLESHVRMQKELKTFAYQSPSKRDAALRTLPPPKRASASEKTVGAQSPEQQLSALATLPAAGFVNDLCSKLGPASNSRDQPDKSTTIVVHSPKARPDCAAETGLNDVSTETIIRYPELPSGTADLPPLRGSEDAMIPNSEDEGSELGDVTPTLDLSSFTFVPT